jgi:hypothetical protein
VDSGSPACRAIWLSVITGRVAGTTRDRSELIPPLLVGDVAFNLLTVGWATAGGVGGRVRSWCCC